MALQAGDFIPLPGRAAFSLYSAIGAPVTDAFAFFPSFPAGETGILNGGGDCSGVGGFFDFTGLHGAYRHLAHGHMVAGSVTGGSFRAFAAPALLPGDTLVRAIAQRVLTC